MEKDYKIDNETQLDKALKWLDALGYEWNSGGVLTDWKPNSDDDDDFPIVLTTGIADKPNRVTYGRFGWGHYKPPFDNLLDAPDYSKGEDVGSEEVDTTEEGQTASEIFSEFLGELSELLGLTEDEELEFDDTSEAEDEETLDDTPNESGETKFIIRLTDRRVVWRVPYLEVMDIVGTKNSFELKSKKEYSITPQWNYHLNVEELAEALSLINLSELASISIVD